MAHVIESPVSNWTAADLVARFGAIPLWRVRSVPPPGSTTAIASGMDLATAGRRAAMFNVVGCVRIISSPFISSYC